MQTDFFSWNHYFIDERVNFFRFENIYKVYNQAGSEIGAIVQRLSLGDKILRMLMNNRFLPFSLDIINRNNTTEATISRGWSLFLSKVTVSQGQGMPIGYIEQQFKFFTPEFKIYNQGGMQIATIKGDWTAWEFTITDMQDREIGSITKKWAGMFKELFTTADKYNVAINPEFTNREHRILILSCALTIDMVFKESDR